MHTGRQKLKVGHRHEALQGIQGQESILHLIYMEITRSLEDEGTQKNR